MRFFHHDSPKQRATTAQEREDDARSRASLEAGGLPLRAQERLGHRAASGDRPILWTSDLSVAEVLTARALQFEPLGQVLGASFYRMAYNALQSSQRKAGEIKVVSQALYEARDRALDRMRQEAIALHAHGIFGVHLDERTYEWESNVLEFLATGTAVRLPSFRMHLRRPFLSNLSGQDTFALLQAGYVPVGLALGFCAFYEYTSASNEMQKHTKTNGEMRSVTSGVRQARRTAMKRMTSEAQKMGADGVVGSDVRVQVHEVKAWHTSPQTTTTVEIARAEDHIIVFTAVGTAVAAIDGEHHPADVTLTLDVGQPDRRATTAPSAAGGREIPPDRA